MCGSQDSESWPIRQQAPSVPHQPEGCPSQLEPRLFTSANVETSDIAAGAGAMKPSVRRRKGREVRGVGDRPIQRAAFLQGRYLVLYSGVVHTLTGVVHTWGGPHVFRGLSFDQMTKLGSSAWP